MTERVDFATAMHTQADSLRVAQAALTSAFDTVELAPWQPGDLVAVVAMGASTHSAEAFVAVLRHAGVRATNVTAADLADVPGRIDVADHYVFVSESGRSPEPVRVAERCTPGRRIAITNAVDSPLAATADAVLPLGGFSDSRVYTSGYTATLLAYDLLARRQLGESVAGPAFDAAALVDHATRQYGERLADVAAWLAPVRTVDLVGRDVSHASAAEGALLLREAARVHTAAFETYQYLHGPMESVSVDSAVIAFGEGRELPMASAILHERTRVLLVTRAPAVDLETDDLLQVVHVPVDVSGFGRAITEATVMQQLAGKLATRRGLDIDEFRFDQPDTKISVSAG